MPFVPIPERDPRPVRAVVEYHDVPAGEGHEREAHDVLECGHEVVCSREPGGRKVVAHAEPCGACLVEALPQ